MVRSLLAVALVLVSVGEVRAQCSVGVSVAVGCGYVPFNGCCLDFHTVLFCENGYLCGLDCTGNGDPSAQVCGWRYYESIYDCGGGGGDPSGYFPISCDGLLPDVNPGGGTGQSCEGVGYEGCCDGSAVFWCEDGQLHGLDCSGNESPADQVCGFRSEAGVYDCGGRGSDPSGSAPRDCSAVVGGGGGTTTPSSCGDVSYSGCCDGTSVFWCEEGALQGLDCAANENVSERTCGWRASHGIYDCGGVGSDPSGQAPRDCGGGGCAPDCAGKLCGPDGCGGECGQCGPDEYCDLGACHVDQQCQPSCSGKECGDNGCGGTCGACGIGFSCDPVSSLCVEATACEPDCDGKVCGPDGCEGTCGACPDGYACSDAGLCAPDGSACAPQCGGKVCGPDGCGGTCGGCPAGYVCGDYGLCVPDTQCTPDCEGRTCGGDGCRGTCGVCPAGYVCNVSGLCEPGDGRPDDGDAPLGHPDPDTPPPSVCADGEAPLWGICIPATDEQREQAVASEEGSSCSARPGARHAGGATGALALVLLAVSALAAGRGKRRRRTLP